MGIGKPPAFQFYPKDWISDENVRFMSLAERGAYITLLAHCWNEGTIPADVGLLAKLCDTSLDEMQRVWRRVEKRFMKSRRSGRLTHKRLELEKKVQRARRLECSAAGKKGAAKRNAIKGVGNGRSSSVGVPGQQSLYSSSSSSSSSSSAIQEIPPNPQGGDVLTSLLESVAKSVWKRHPNRDRIVPAEKIQTKLKAIAKLYPKDERIAMISRLDSNHALFCETEEWTRSAARFCPGIEPWLNQGNKFWEKPPIMERQAKEDEDPW